MRHGIRVAVAAVAAVAIGMAGISVAQAAPEPTGFDDSNDTVLGGGSDTTYVVAEELTSLYDATPGCDTDNTTGSATLAKCLTGAAQTATDTKGDWDHDVLANVYPTGSSAGVKALQLGQVDFARSSRGPKASGEGDLNFWGFAKDGITVVTMAGRAAANITKAQVQGIYNCTITQWSAITGNAADTATIQPYGMNPASGTKASMDLFLGFDANGGACVKKLSTGVYPFENDVKQLIDDPAALGPNAIWWGSFAELKTYSYKRQSAAFWSVDGVAVSNGAIANNTYPMKRFVFHVTKKADASPAASPAFPAQLTGADAGKAGAVRQFTEWMCKTAPDHTTNPFFGSSYYTDITSKIVGSGYQRIPAAERTHGACVLQPGA